MGAKVEGPPFWNFTWTLQVRKKKIIFSQILSEAKISLAKKTDQVY